MKLSIRGLTLALGILWGGIGLLCAVANLIWPPYADVFLNCLASIYPGYDHASTAWSVVVVTLYALVDGAVAGLVFGALYNACAVSPFRDTAEKPASH